MPSFRWNPLPIALLCALFAASWPDTTEGQGANAVSVLSLELTPSYEHVGIRLAIDGDVNRDARVTLRFRPADETGWRTGLPLVRSHRGLVGEGGERPDERFAGSVFWLVPGERVTLELTVSDPDGGGATLVENTVTRRPQAPAPDARVRHVAPPEPGAAAGSGDGSVQAPFRGLQRAADAAEAGDLFLVTSGTYAPFALIAGGEPGRPIVFRGPAADEAPAIVDGAGIDRGIVTIGRNDRTTEHVIIERLRIENGRWGIDAQHTRDLTVRHVRMRAIDHGVVNRRGEGREARQTVCDSSFEGRVPWPGAGIPAEQAVHLRGTGNVVCHNRIKDFGDGVSVQPSTGDAWGNDVYGNDILRIVDDPIEVDYNNANVRVWGNRVTSGRMGISLAPIFGGPAYVFRNTFFSLASSAYKMNREPAGLVIAHNTSLKRGNGMSSPAGWQNTQLRNNMLFGTRYLFEEYGLARESTDDWDHDAFAREPGCDPGTPPCFKWDDVRYDTLADLRAGTGIEAHGVMAARADLQDAPLPTDYATPIAPNGYDLRPREGSPLIDAGASLPNLNDPWVTDDRPDIGAHELGAPLPHYGPRPEGAALGYLAGGALGPPTAPTRPTASATPTATAHGTATATVTSVPAATSSPVPGETATPNEADTWIALPFARR